MNHIQDDLKAALRRQRRLICRTVFERIEIEAQNKRLHELSLQSAGWLPQQRYFSWQSAWRY
jgi:hypothetical protein